MLAVLASFAAWIFPTFGVLQKGFEAPSRLDLTSALVLVLWYLLIYAAFSVGQKVGELASIFKGRQVDPLLSLDSNLIYCAFSFLSAVGVIAVLVSIFGRLSPQEALARIVIGQTNALKEALYEDYSVGLPSLRYLVLYSASIALYRIIRLKDRSFFNLFNVVMLAVITFLSSRLMLIATVVTTTFLVTRGRQAVRIHVTKTLSAAACLFLVLSVLNISRNAAFYQSNGLSFWLAGVNEIDAYLGTPFQVEVGTAKFTDQLAAGGTGSGALGGEPYRQYAELEVNYMTNSAFVHLHQQMGYLSWLYVGMLCCFMGFMFEWLGSMGRTIFLLPCGAILYASAELWRLDLFQQGTFIVWFVIGIGLPVSMMLMRQLSRFLGKLYAMPSAPNIPPDAASSNGA